MDKQHKYITRGYVLYNEKFDGYLGKDKAIVNRPEADIYGNIRMLQMIKNKRKDSNEWIIKKVTTIHLEEDLVDENN
jgi:hypothetical protein